MNFLETKSIIDHVTKQFYVIFVSIPFSHELFSTSIICRQKKGEFFGSRYTRLFILYGREKNTKRAYDEGKIKGKSFHQRISNR